MKIGHSLHSWAVMSLCIVMTFGLPDSTSQTSQTQSRMDTTIPCRAGVDGCLQDNAVQLNDCQIPAVIPGTVCLAGGGKGYSDGCARGRPLGCPQGGVVGGVWV